MTTTEFIQFLLERFQIEWKRRDRSGIYGLTQRLLAYNSNKIEGSALTEVCRHLSLIPAHFQNQMIITEQKM